MTDPSANPSYVNGVPYSGGGSTSSAVNPADNPSYVNGVPVSPPVNPNGTPQVNPAEGGVEWIDGVPYVNGVPVSNPPNPNANPNVTPTNPWGVDLSQPDIVTLDTGEIVDQTSFLNLDADEQLILKTKGIEGWQNEFTVALNYKDPETGLPQRINKEFYNSLDDTDKQRLNESGIEAVQSSGELYPADFKANNVQLDTGEWVDREFFNSPDVTDEQRQFLKVHGIEAFNQEYNQAVDKDTLALYNRNIEDFITKSGGDIAIYNALPTDTEKQTYISGLYTTQVNNFITLSGGSIETYNNLGSDIEKESYLQGLQSKSEKEYQDYESAKETLVPYVSTDQWQQISEPNGEFVNPTYNLSTITQADLKNNPQIKIAVATLFPDYDVSKLGIRYVDINQYKILGRLLPINSLGQLDQNGKVPEAGVPFYDENLGEIVTPRIGITLNEYYDRIRVENEAGRYDYGNVPQVYFPVVTLTEWEKGNQARLSEQGVVIRPNIQEITREMAGIDPTKELSNVDAAKLFGLGFSVPFQVVVPFVATGVGLATKTLSGGWLGVSILSDALSTFPLVRAVSLGARAVSTAGKMARVNAIVDAVGRELIANIKAPFTMLRHPIATVQSGGRTIADEFENIFSKNKINEAVITTSNTTVKIRIGVDMTEAEALVARDALVSAVRNGEAPTIQLTNEAGDVVSEVNLAQSPLMKEIGGGVVHATPVGEEYISSLAEKGFVTVKLSEGTDGMGLFISLEPHPRFLQTSAYGVAGEQPTIMIWSKDSAVAKSVISSGKIYNRTAEIEGVVPPNTVLWKDNPAQILYTRVGPNRTKTMIWLDKPLSDWQLIKLKVLGIIEGVKAPFKQPITFKGQLIDSLTDAEIRALREELELSGNARVADSLIDAVRGDEGLIGSLRLSGQIRAGTSEDARIFAEDLKYQNELNAERQAFTREDSVIRGERVEIPTSRYREEDAIVRENRELRESSDREMARITQEDRIARGEKPERIERTEELSRVERVEDADRISRTEEPERIDRAEDVERITRAEEPERIIRAEEPERISRISEPPRLTRPPRIIEPPRIIRPPRIIEPPRIIRPPKILRPPKLIGSSKQLTKEQLIGAIGWKQGIMFKYIYPPYGQEDIINSRTPIQGIPIKEGVRSAYETIIRTRKGFIPPNITRYMGMMDLVITDADKNGQPEIKFIEREKRKGKGSVATKASLMKL